MIGVHYNFLIICPLDDFIDAMISPNSWNLYFCHILVNRYIHIKIISRKLFPFKKSYTISTYIYYIWCSVLVKNYTFLVQAAQMSYSSRHHEMRNRPIDAVICVNVILQLWLAGQTIFCLDWATCYLSFTYRIIWKTTRRYIYITRTETRIIHEILKYLCSDNANFKAIFSHYNPGRVVI